MKSAPKLFDAERWLLQCGAPLLLLDADGRVRYANDAALSLCAGSHDQLLDKPLSLIYGGDGIKAEYEMSVAKKRGRYAAEGWRSRADGSRFWGEIVLTPFRDPDTGFEGLSCLLNDRSTQKKEELSLRRSEEVHRLMIENVRDYAIFLLDTTGHIMTWNEGARRIKGYSADEIIGKHFSTFYTREDLDTEKPRRELEIAIATGKYEEEGWRVKKDGSLFWGNIVITALFNEQNQHVGFSKVTRDLTERRQAQEQLRQSEERYRLLVQQVSDYGIFMMDEKGRIISWNEGAEKINGWSASEITGSHFSIFYPEEDIRNDKPGFELRVAKATGKYEEEGWRLRKDGSRFWASIVITALFDNNGYHIGFSKVTRDLTERKEAERALRESYDRYRQLTETLSATNAELSYINQELEQFTSVASHDLQEPIRTIKSFLQLMDTRLDQGHYDDLKLYVGKSIAAAQRMRDLIQNLLQYSQIDKGQLAEEDVDVAELLHTAQQNLKSAISTSGAELSIESEVSSIRGDQVQLLQLIQNLLSNAIKFTNREHPRIRISCKDEGGHVRFAITDNGIGIAEGDLEKVFEIFRRLSTERSYPGTGIGLAICKKIVERHQGRIWPESQPGKGTTFYFTLRKANFAEQLT
jgi:PAS domain S-box-containing protein